MIIIGIAGGTGSGKTTVAKKIFESFPKNDIVLFKLKETLSAEEKLEVMTQFKNAIESLPATIEVIRHIFVGMNMNPAEQWDICLDSEFDSLEDLKIYAAHPDHVAAAAILKDAKADRACTDYTF